MKLKAALKKFNFLKKFDYPDEVTVRIANSLLSILKGSDDILTSPLCDSMDNPYHFMEGWNKILISNAHKLNGPLSDLECSSLSKFGPRSQTVPWSQREQSIKVSWSNQDENHVPKFHHLDGPGYLLPISLDQAFTKMKQKTSASHPFMVKKEKASERLLADFDKYHKRRDPCALYTRSGENKKTRNIWGFPFADTLFDMMFYVPLMLHQRTLEWRASLVGPEEVADKITKIINYAMATSRIVYSVDFAGFDASVKYQYIIESFNYFKRCFSNEFESFITYMCERFYTIELVTPTGVLRGKHGVCSGSNFTNEVDSVVQAIIALTCKFISTTWMIIQGDDGVYTMFKDEINAFDAAFTYAGLKLEKSKSVIASNYAVFCQYLFHDDYRDVHGRINGIYPTCRAINRLLFPEKAMDFKGNGIKCKDYYGIRAITILENCKYHPLHEELVRYVMAHDSFKMDFSDEGLSAFSLMTNGTVKQPLPGENYQFGTNVSGIKGFKTYQLIRQILADEQPKSD